MWWGSHLSINTPDINLIDRDDKGLTIRPVGDVRRERGIQPLCLSWADWREAERQRVGVRKGGRKDAEGHPLRHAWIDGSIVLGNDC